MSLSFDLLFLIESHRPICRWLGPYEEDDATCDVAHLYRDKFEGKLASLLISISSNLRIMEDRRVIHGNLIGSFNRGEAYDPADSQVYQSRVGEILNKETGEWNQLFSLRDLLNAIMHSDRIEFSVSELEAIQPPAPSRTVRGFDNLVVVSAPKGKNAKAIKTIRLNLQNFSRYLFDIVEEMKHTIS